MRTKVLLPSRKPFTLFLTVSAVVAVAFASDQFSSCQAAPTVTRIAAGGKHTLFIKSDGSLWAVGWQFYGQLGDGQGLKSPGYTAIPKQILPSGVTQISAGDQHTLFRKSDGSLWVMGDDENGQLGDGRPDDGTYYTNLPHMIVSRNVSIIAAGARHSLFSEFRQPVGPGSLWSMGRNASGELGTGGTTQTNTPQEIVSGTLFGTPAITAIAGGQGHSLFVEPGGSLWGMGYNGAGQLGDGTINNRYSPIQILSSGVGSVAAGANHSLFIKSDGSLWAIGWNNSGQLGIGNLPDQHLPVKIVGSNVTAVAAGYSHSLFVKSNGSLWAMGNNQYGQLGDGTTSNRFTPVQIVASNVVSVAAGDGYHSLFIKSDGSLWAMGADGSGQLGDGTNTDSHIPIQVVPFAVRNSGFESGDFQGWLASGNLSQTFVTTKSAYGHSGRYGAELGPSGSLGFLSQNFVTTPGSNFWISLWLNSPDGVGPNEFRVTWNGTTIFDGVNLPAVGWTNLLFAVSATGPNSMLQLGFRNDNSSFGLDDVHVVLQAPLMITGIHVADTNVVLDASGGIVSRNYLTLMSSDISLPVAQWNPVATNAWLNEGDFTITATNGVNPNFSDQFYILRMQN